MNPYNVDLRSAGHFVVEHGNIIEEARLQAIIAGQPGGEEIFKKFQEEQSEMGGWKPPWASDYVAIDATCFRLAQLESLGVTEYQPVFERALNFLADTQNSAGFWEETPEDPSILPDWLAPGQVHSRVYLTANALFWLTVSNWETGDFQGAIVFLQDYMDDQGRLPGPDHAQWLAAAACYAIDEIAIAEMLTQPLAEGLSELSASSLAWMLTSLLIAGVSVDDDLIQRAARQLAGLQQPDGPLGERGWPGLRCSYHIGGNAGFSVAGELSDSLKRVNSEINGTEFGDHHIFAGDTDFFSDAVAFVSDTSQSGGGGTGNKERFYISIHPGVFLSSNRYDLFPIILCYLRLVVI